MRHRPEIDGLRAFAVLPVILYHAGLGPFPGGYVGVDVFFVLSGFLITSLLAEDLERGRYSLAGFYERRARRLIPALALVLGATTLGALAILPPEQLQGYAASLLASALFYANVHFWLNSGYFAPGAEDLPLLHVWSLAVEEQFYLIFPPVLALLWRRGLPLARRVLWGAVLASLLLCLAGIADYPGATFFLLPSRAWELLAGSLLALHLHAAPRGGRALPASIGFGLILLSAMTFTEETPFPSHFTLVPVLGTVLVLRYAAPGQWVFRILTWRPFVLVGLVSYSAYLWHQPLLVLARAASYDPPGPWLRAGLVVLTLVLAAATWAFVEQPFRGRPARWLPGRTPILGASAAVLLLAAAAGISGIASAGWPRLWEATRPQAVVATHRLLSQRDQRAEDPFPGPCRFNLYPDEDARTPLADIVPRLRDCAARHGPGIAVLGDSHGSDLYRALLASSDRPFLVGLARGSCRFHDGKPGCPYDALAAFLRDSPDALGAIIFEQAAYPLLRSERFGASTRDIFTALAVDEPVPATRPVAARIGEPRDYLAALPGTARIIWFGPRPVHYIPDRFILAKGCDYPFRLRPGMLDPIRMLDAAIREAVAGTRIEYVSQLELMDLTLPGDLMDCGAIYWTDGDHFSAEGEIRFGRRFDLVNRLRL
ncbi:acyltransferase family protein [Mangrovicoccus algicola]|uniref:Acyltransferase n=1 Tax=Mangrovicoccus algicola TaxID=2771008 RepID=A0A8J7CGE9_9RHOB|nr:acyltransferase [Mangrovicoccus algicola]MBE3637050.1 acyltransferase [Mangrovicoccus algicola]